MLSLTQTGSVCLLLNHDLELRSSSFTFGKTQTSLVFLSLNHDLFTILDIDSMRRLGDAASAEVVDGSSAVGA